MSLRQLEWLAILAPLVFLGVVYFLVLGPVHPLFHTPIGFLILAAALTSAVWTFSRSVFGAVRALQTEVEELSAETASYNQRLVSLHEANLTLTRETGVEEALQSIVGTGAQLLDACHSALSLAGDGDSGRVITLGGSEAGEPRCELGRRLHGSDGTPAPEAADAIEAGSHLLSIPVATLGSPIGTLRLARPDDGPAFTPIDAEIARTTSTHAALVVQNDRLYDEVRALAIEAERQALAREMHDSLAQVLAFVNTKAQAVEQYLRRDDLTEARQQMAELSAAAREVYADIRQGIAALRVDTGGKTLHELIEGYALEFGESAHVEVAVDWRVADHAIDLPPAGEVQLLRIVQESLANVRRHAHASRVDLRAEATEGTLTLEVRDDGRGFDSAARSGDGRPRFGLQTMRERAVAIGGDLVVESTPGSGTTVRVSLPAQARR